MQDWHSLILTLCRFVDPLNVNFRHIIHCLYWNYPWLIILKKLIIKLCLHQNCKNTFFTIANFLKSVSDESEVGEDDLNSLSKDQHQQAGYLARSYALLKSLRMQLSLLCPLTPPMLLVFILSIEPWLVKAQRVFLKSYFYYF